MVTLLGNSRRASLLILALLTAGTGPARGQDRHHRPCQASDLPNLWQVVRWSSSIDREKLNSYAAPHQWYLFGTDGTLRSVTSNRPSNDVAKIREALESLPAVTHYSCRLPGEVRTTRSDVRGADETWRAYYILYDTVGSSGNVRLKAGDVVMMLLDDQERPIYTRQMRQLGVAEPEQLGPR